MSKQLTIYQRSKQETQTISNLHLWHGDPLLLKVSGSYGGIWVEEYGRRGVWNRGTRDFNLYVHVQVTIEAKEGAYILQALIFFFFIPMCCPPYLSPAHCESAEREVGSGRLRKSGWGSPLEGQSSPLHWEGYNNCIIY